MKSDSIIPKFRKDLRLTVYKEDNTEFLILQDNLNLGSEPVLITSDFYHFIENLRFDATVSDLKSILSSFDNETINLIIENIEFLDNNFLLDNQNYLQRRDFIQSEYLSNPIRPYIFAGNSYPKDIKKLNSFLDDLFSSSTEPLSTSKASAIIVPHIDLSLKDFSHPVYCSGYKSVAETDFDLIVIFGTAHNESSDYFMLSRKDYSTPLGVVETNNEFINLWQDKLGYDIHINEFAHKNEHSIEFQVLLSQYFFKNKNFKILPILVGSFYNNIVNKSLPESDIHFYNLVQSFKVAISESGLKPLYIASVDFAHVGKKFGDDFDALNIIDELKVHDMELIDYILNNDKVSFIKKISDDCDKFKICGTSPIYSLLSVGDFTNTQLLKYNQWYEPETQSAVSFASVSLSN